MVRVWQFSTKLNNTHKMLDCAVSIDATYYFVFRLCKIRTSSSPHFWFSQSVNSQPTPLLLCVNSITLSLNSHPILYAENMLLFKPFDPSSDFISFQPDLAMTLYSTGSPQTHFFFDSSPSLNTILFSSTTPLPPVCLFLSLCRIPLFALKPEKSLHCFSSFLYHFSALNTILCLYLSHSSNTQIDQCSPIWNFCLPPTV